MWDFFALRKLARINWIVLLYNLLIKIWKDFIMQSSTSHFPWEAKTSDEVLHILQTFAHARPNWTLTSEWWFSSSAELKRYRLLSCLCLPQEQDVTNHFLTWWEEGIGLQLAVRHCLQALASFLLCIEYLAFVGFWTRLWEHSGKIFCMRHQFSLSSCKQSRMLPQVWMFSASYKKRGIIHLSVGGFVKT